MSYRPPVLLIDDGELEDVFQTLGDLGVEPARLSGDAAAGDEWFWPTQLLVTTARRGLALDLVSASERSEFTTIAVARDAAQTTQTMLRRVGFDYLVRRPVHPEALRLLLLRALYGARERRGEPRYPLGFGVTLRRGMRRRRATLTEISVTGCRLLVRKCVERGARVAVRIPRALAGGIGLTLEGRVVRCRARTAPSGPTLWSVAISFGEFAEGERERLEALLSAITIGPPPLARPVVGSPTRSKPAEQIANLARVLARVSRRDRAAEESAVEESVAEDLALPLGEDEALASPAPVDTREVSEEIEAETALPDGDARPAEEERSAAEREVLPTAEGGGLARPAAADPPERPDSRGEVPEPIEDEAGSAELQPNALEDDDSPTRAHVGELDAVEDSGVPAIADLRHHRRGAFPREVVALDVWADRVLYVLVGRDLSGGGIRVEAHPDLEVGDTLRLAVYDAAAKEPFVLEARVERDDGDCGLGLRFVGVSERMAQQVEQLVAGLPAVEAFGAGGSGGVVMAEILDD